MSKLFELVGADPDCRFSPYCHRIRRALAHKGLAFESVPVRFTEKDELAFSGQELVPVLVDGDTVVSDSWAIACHLDDTYTGAPPLMAGAQARALTLTIKSLVEPVVHPAVLRVVLLDIFAAITPADQAYFRQSRESRFGVTLEEFCLGEDGVPALHAALAPFRTALAKQPFLAGDRAGFADYILAGAFDWAFAVSGKVILADDDPLSAWHRSLPG